MVMSLRTCTLLVALSASAAHGQALTARLDSAMQVAERSGFSGVVLVEKDGAIVLQKGYGMADRAKRLPFTAATVVQIGSNTKDFTAVAILQLQQAGLLSMNDSITKYFRIVPAHKRGITVRQLMNHRAGFPLGVGDDFEAIGRAALITRALQTPLLFPPGSRESYSNTGYSLLAAIIEQVTGKTYDVHVRDAILAPVGLTRTGFLLPRFAPGDLAHGYQASGRDAGTMLAKAHANDGPYWNLRGNGGMLSTVADMHRFYGALVGGEKLLAFSARNGRFNPEEPVGLAGSDGVNLFLYDRFPRLRSEIIIASTSASMKAPMVRRELGKVLGLTNPDDEPNEQMARREGGTPAPSGIASVLSKLISTLNSGDMAALRAFVADQFASKAGGPVVSERVERFSQMHENLGVLTMHSAEVFADGPLEVRVTSAVQGTLLLRIAMEGAAPYRIESIQVILGG